MKRRSSKIIRRSSNGFSLIEVLVVLAIIGVLAAILFPTMRSFRAKADSTKCMGNLRQIGSLVGLYMADNSGSLPYSSGFNYTGAGANSYGFDHHAAPLPVLAGVGEGVTLRSWYDQPGDRHIFNCPSHKDGFRSYGANANVMAFAPGGGKPVLHSDVNRPSAKILIADKGKTGLFRKIEEIGDRHAGKANVLFADFHIESMKREQLTVDDNLKK